MSSPTPPADVAALFEPLTLGPITLPNKIIMSALTRARSVPTNIPNELNVEYYTQRAKGGAGLIVSEGVPVVLQGCVSDILYSMHSLTALHLELSGLMLLVYGVTNRSRDGRRLFKLSIRTVLTFMLSSGTVSVPLLNLHGECIAD